MAPIIKSADKIVLAFIEFLPKLTIFYDLFFLFHFMEAVHEIVFLLE